MPSVSIDSGPFRLTDGRVGVVCTVSSYPYPIKLLQVLNARYLIVEGDAISGSGLPVGSFNLSRIMGGISALGLQRLYQWGNVSIYLVPRSPGLFYSPSHIMISNATQVPGIIAQSDYDPLTSVILTPYSDFGNVTSQQLEAMRWASEHAVAAEILGVSGSVTSGFEVKVSSKGPFVLVFSQSYDPGWRLLVDDSPVPSHDHFVAYGYANAWLINATGKLNLYIYYSPQLTYERLYLISFAVAMLILTASVILLRDGLTA
jgi:hypothetical protein